MGKSVKGRNLSSLSAIALIVVLIAYPAIRLSGVADFDVERDRSAWWMFWLCIFAGHWMLFGLVLLAVTRQINGWQSLGFSAGWPLNQRRRITILIGFFLVAAVVLPKIYYDSVLPPHARLHPLGPISSAERVFWVFLAVTAGMVEETAYRGFALTRLKTILRNAWLAVPVALVPFVFIHGTNPINLIAPTVAGFLFCVAFLWLGCKRLEILVTTHFVIDALFVLLP